MAELSKLALLNTPAHRAVARQVAVEDAVLLQNTKHVLPLPVTRPGKAGGRYKIAIVGPSAGCTNNATDCSALREQVGGYTGRPRCGYWRLPTTARFQLTLSKSASTLASPTGCQTILLALQRQWLLRGRRMWWLLQSAMATEPAARDKIGLTSTCLESNRSC